MLDEVVKEIKKTKMALTRSMRMKNKEGVRDCQFKLIRLELKHREMKKRAI